MYLSRISIQNIRGFKDIDIDLARAANSEAPWTTILGDNSSGKTTLLRCIAMGISGESGASGLLSDLYGEWLRDPSLAGEIKLEFQVNGNRRKYSVNTVITEKFGEYQIAQTPSKKFPLKKVFMCGYGTGRSILGDTIYETYATVDSVYSLFVYSSSLQNPELILRRIKDAGVSKAALLNRVDRILMLPAGSTDLGRSGITVKEPGGKAITIGALADAYQATITLICDLLHWSLLYNQSAFKRGKLKGIVLIDELEQHLHPVWQRKIIALLRQQFPALQFIVTTHSPLCASGTADLDDDLYSFVLLRPDKERAIHRIDLPPLEGRRADEMLTSEAFGLPTSRSVETEKKLRELAELETKKRMTPKQKRRYKHILTELKEEAPTAAEYAEDRQVRQQIHELLEELTKNSCGT